MALYCHDYKGSPRVRQVMAKLVLSSRQIDSGGSIGKLRMFHVDIHMGCVGAPFCLNLTICYWSGSVRVGVHNDEANVESATGGGRLGDWIFSFIKSWLKTFSVLSLLLYFTLSA